MDRPATRPYGRARHTGQREAIARSIDDLPGAFTADELYTVVAAEDAGIGKATVYRALGALAETGWIERVGERSGSALFARCNGGTHHHHLVCTACGAITRAECPLEHVIERSAAESGFTVTHHEITIYGLCARCGTSECES